MVFQLSNDINIYINDDEIFNNLARSLGLPSDWMECYISDDKLLRSVRYGPEEVQEVVTNDSDKLKKFQYLYFLYNSYKK